MSTSTVKKLTKRDYFNMIKAVLPEDAEGYASMTAFIDHEIELLDKKNSGEKKLTAQQTANEGIKDAIVEGMEENRLYTVTELIKEVAECNELTNQRVSALLRQLISEGKVVKTVDKRKSYFQLVG